MSPQWPWKEDWAPEEAEVHICLIYEEAADGLEISCWGSQSDMGVLCCQ